LLPCGYFHLVFTLPHDLNPIILCNKKITLQILFDAVSETLQATRLHFSASHMVSDPDGSFPSPLSDSCRGLIL
jgi:hypothetical protein